jgi:digeranylgeranylglycerophospholipid reductase
LYDVAVVGAGPVGNYLAYKLADMGHGVVVLERKETFSEPVCCTGVISRECVCEFDIDENVVLRWANGATLFSPSGKRLRLWREEPPACVIDRAALDMTMAGRAQDRGAEYVLGSLVENVGVGDARVKVEAIHQGGRLDFEARAVVIASGFASGFTERLGLGDIGDFTMGAQAEVETVGVGEVEVYLGRGRAPGFFAWLVPTSSARALVGLASRRSAGSYMRKLLSSLLAEGKIVSAEAEICYKGIPLKPLAKTCSDRLLVVGDVAGQVKPTTGGGIYYGLLCADIAADNLHRALAADDLSTKSLAGYERGWKRKLGRELKVGQYARRFYERLSDRNLDRVFDITRASGVGEVLSKVDDISFDWHGEAITRLVRSGVLTGVIKAVKIPFRL